MTCRACEEARRAALAFYDRMAAAARRAAEVRSRRRTRIVRRVDSDVRKYHDRPWREGRG